MNSNNPNNIKAYMRLKLSLILMGWKPKNKKYNIRSPFAWIDPTKQLELKILNYNNLKKAYKYGIVTEINNTIEIYEKCNSYLELLECVSNFDMNRIKK